MESESVKVLYKTPISEPTASDKLTKKLLQLTTKRINIYINNSRQG